MLPGLIVDTVSSTIDLFLRATAFALVSHFLRFLSSTSWYPVERSNRPSLCQPTIQPFKVHFVVVLVLEFCPFHFLSILLSWPFSLQWDDVAGLRPEITQVIQRPGFLLCAFDWYKIRTALQPKPSLGICFRVIIRFSYAAASFLWLYPLGFFWCPVAG